MWDNVDNLCGRTTWYEPKNCPSTAVTGQEHGTGAATAVGTARKSLTVSGNLKGLKHAEIC